MTPDDYLRRWAHECLLDAAAAVTSGADQAEVDYHMSWCRRFMARVGRGDSASDAWRQRRDQWTASAVRSSKAPHISPARRALIERLAEQGTPIKVDPGKAI